VWRQRPTPHKVLERRSAGDSFFLGSPLSMLQEKGSLILSMVEMLLDNDLGICEPLVV
jgi:hypothetical protein